MKKNKSIYMLLKTKFRTKILDNFYIYLSKKLKQRLKDMTMKIN